MGRDERNKRAASWTRLSSGKMIAALLSTPESPSFNSSFVSSTQGTSNDPSASVYAETLDGLEFIAKSRRPTSIHISALHPGRLAHSAALRHR